MRWLLALVCASSMPSVAWAHATLVRSTPAVGSRLSAWPSQLVLVFSEEVEAGLARVSISGSKGQTFTVPLHSDPHDVNALIGVLSEAPNDAYTLTWRVVSADGHPVDGSFTFTIGDETSAHAPPPVTGQHSSDSANVPLAAALFRGLALGFLMAVAGLLGFRAAAKSALTNSTILRSDRALVRLALLGALFAIAHFVAWLAHVSPSGALDPEALREIISSDVGRLEAWRTGLIVMTAWAVALARRPTLGILFGAGALLVSGAAGHSAAISPMIATPAKIVHLVAGALWLGGLAWLLCIEGTDVSLLQESRRVSSGALVAVLLVAVSGVAQALLFLPTPLDFVRTTYGALVIAKIAGLLALTVFGARHRFRSLPRLEDDISNSRLFHVSLRREVAVMMAVVIVGAVLAYVPPATH